ncbi:hypothetical protein [Saccharospirillum mangrovi]|uniref:hypothetical protein n=1 Tax=Saccharospirillum mangrovi TaxID=2161747 RepID=UPI000D33D865|nr:hypothetical protein [Saccharospirillum mangrovi]
MKRLLILVLLSVGMANAQTVEFIGQAYDLDSGRLLYREIHQLTLTDGQPTRETIQFLDPDDQPLAHKIITYIEPARPAFEMYIPAEQRQDSVLPMADGVHVSGRENGVVAWPKQAAIIDAGFHYFVLQHFDELKAGHRLDVEFLIASRLRWVALTLEPTSIDEQQMVVQLTVQNAVLRWLIDPIELTYDMPRRRLLEYRGLIRVPGEDGGNYQARIRYQYEAIPS